MTIRTDASAFSVNDQGNPSYSYDTNGKLTGETVGGTARRIVGCNSFNKVDNITQTSGGVNSRVEYIYDADLDRVHEIYNKNRLWR